MRWPVSLAIVFLSVSVSAASPVTRVWELATDFEGGSAYSIFTQTLTGGLARLLPDYRYDYSADPLATAPWFWTKSTPPIRKTFSSAALPGITVVTEPALASSGNYIFLVGGCVGSGAAAVTSAKVWFCEVDSSGNMQDWQKATWEFGQTQNDPEGIPVISTRAVAINNRIYVAGGSTQNCGIAAFVNQEQATSAVYSAPIVLDPATKKVLNVGPWVKEPSLLRTVASHGFVYAAGALFTIGGRENKKTPVQPIIGEWAPHQWVQKAEIKPDGHLSNWMVVMQVPIGVPPYAGGVATYCECQPVSWCIGTDLACCRNGNLGLGWEQVGSFSVGRTIGFIGGTFTKPPILSSTCRYFIHGYYAYLDDNNNISEWVGLTADKGRGRPGVSPQVYNGSFISVGGETAGAVPDVIHNPTGGEFGIERDASYGYDATEFRLNYGMLDIEDNLSPYKFNVAAVPVPMVMVRNFIFAMGHKENGNVPTADVYRNALLSATTFVNSAYFISKPYDVNGNYQLTNVTWTFIKNGNGCVGKPDDWAMVRYRLADENMNWTAWTPRIPEAGNMPLTAGTYSYAYLNADGSKRTRSSTTWMALNTSTFRYIQFEVSLYKDSATPNRPEFTKFEIEYRVPPPVFTVEHKFEVFPVPAVDNVNMRFKVVSEGAEVKVTLFNVAGEPVADQNFVYASGGDKAVTMTVSGFANGTYIAVVRATSVDGGAGLISGNERVSKVTGKVVVRHKK